MSAELCYLSISKILIPVPRQANPTAIIDDKCVVILCNKNIRNQSDNLKFVGFPKNNSMLCKLWWELCGRSDESIKDHLDLKFPYLIHFKPKDIVSILLKQDNHLFCQTMLKDMFTKSTKSLKPCKVLKSSTKLSSPMSMEINSDSSGE